MLEFSYEKVVGKVAFTTSVNITEDDVFGIIVGSVEGGSNYWMGLDKSGAEWEDRPKGEPLSTWATKLLLEGKSVKVYDIEDKTERWEITLEKLLKGIRLNNEKRPHDNNLENADATTYDCIVQYALFDKVVYG